MAERRGTATELRRWFAHKPSRWEGFVLRYREKLKSADDGIGQVRQTLAGGTVTFVYGSKEERCNNAVALKEYIEAGK